MQKPIGTTNAQKEADVKRILSLVVALGVAALFSSAALAGADCSYHQTQAAVSKPADSKDVATAPVNDNNTNQVQTAQASTPPAKPAPEVKK
jgi:hypothetical protein